MLRYKVQHTSFAGTRYEPPAPNPCLTTCGSQAKTYMKVHSVWRVFLGVGPAMIGVGSLEGSAPPSMPLLLLLLLLAQPRPPCLAGAPLGHSDRGAVACHAGWHGAAASE